MTEEEKDPARQKFASKLGPGFAKTRRMGKAYREYTRDWERRLREQERVYSGEQFR